MSDEKSKMAARVALSQYIHSKKLRRTPERYTILDKVFDISEHFSIETLYTALEEDGFHVSKATLYNSIQLFIECGLLRKHQFDGKSAQYERATRVGNHHHLICTQCGKIKEVKDVALVNMLNARRYPTFHTAYFALYVYGTCSRCQRANKKNEKKK
ncbi:MAG: transcriptional repressor [Muribaculaceae bacterium]|jgi:Fur family ferric uptake transcriptional regulator|nr:transcriptional repressor [Muribaculaceae bacterium]